MGITDSMIKDFAERLKAQTTYKVLTYLEVREKTGKHTDSNFIRCYYPDRDKPSMLTVYFHEQETHLVGREDDLDDFMPKEATKESYRKNLILMKTDEPADSTHAKTLKTVLEIIDHIGKKKGYVTTPVEPIISSEIRVRRDDLFDCVSATLDNLPVLVNRYGPDVRVMFQDMLICGVSVLDETYKLYNVSREWKAESKYKCEAASDDTFYCYIDTIDECIEETNRLVRFEARKGDSKRSDISYQSQMQKSGLDDSKLWVPKTELRPYIRALLDPLVNDTEYELVDAEASEYLDLKDMGKTAFRMRIADYKKREFLVYFNAGVYKQVKQRIDLPPNSRPSKTGEHIYVDLAKVWDIVCAYTGKPDLFVNA